MSLQITKKVPELLAPAGSMESFHAAVNAGADAVYLGLDVFNARMRAKNFTIKTLSYLLPYAHDHGVKIYVTLNTLIKQSELESLIHILYQLEQIGIDALIVADTGLIEIVRNSFSSLKLHGSTQMAVHNQTGMKCAKQLGLTRVVLARELSCEEIANIIRSTSLQTEVFIHGALCYSFSGMCLASSFIGGASGNRGMCTQVCRRKFSEKKSNGYFFSPPDFCGIDFLVPMIKAGVSSFKIEGRMKGPEYVDTVVRAYRIAINDPDNIHEAKEMLAFDLGRPKTSLFLGGVTFEKLINHLEASGTGFLIGKIIHTDKNTITVSGVHKLFPGDRIRVHPDDGFEGIAANVAGCLEVKDGLCIELKVPVGNPGDQVYLISRKNEQSRLSSEKKISNKSLQFRTCCPSIKNVFQKVSSRPVPKQSRNSLWVKIDRAKWLDELCGTPCQHLIFSVSMEEAQLFLEDQQRLKIWRSRIIPAFPPFIADKEIAGWKDLISSFIGHGIKKFACSNMGQISLFPSGVELIADNPLWILNSASQIAMKKLGFKYFAFSTEDEYLNVKDCPSDCGILYVYSHIPLFISRMANSVSGAIELSDPHGNRFISVEKHGLYYLLGKKPLCLTHRISKMNFWGVQNYLVDLSFTEPGDNLLQNIMEAYKSGTKVKDSSMFNFKAGLR